MSNITEKEQHKPVESRKEDRSNQSQLDLGTGGLRETESKALRGAERQVMKEAKKPAELADSRKVHNNPGDRGAVQWDMDVRTEIMDGKAKERKVKLQKKNLEIRIPGLEGPGRCGLSTTHKCVSTPNGICSRGWA